LGLSLTLGKCSAFVVYMISLALLLSMTLDSCAAQLHACAERLFQLLERNQARVLVVEGDLDEFQVKWNGFLGSTGDSTP